MRSVFLFRRDLRLADNTGLLRACAESEEVIPCFVLDPRQCDAGENPYAGLPALSFLRNSLRELDDAFAEFGTRLHVLYGQAEAVLPAFAVQAGAQAVFLNRDYTPFSRLRDERLAAACAAVNVRVHASDDALLCPPEDVHKADGTPYTVFTPFFKAASRLSVRPPRPAPAGRFATATAGNLLPREDVEQLLPASLSQYALQGGRREGERLLAHVPSLARYAEERNTPALPGTSRLAAHHKFGTVSVRETLAAVLSAHGPEHGLIAELYWRDFFTHIAWHFPRVFGHAFKQQYDRLPWSESDEAFKAWRFGTTGFPIVDAGMRELMQSGTMHNRVRMIAASFLVKDLHLDWRWGERYFAQHLLDYDPAVNNGNWQWAASTGCDAQPYFRIFNPWLQQKKFDPDCVYIKRWVPELAALEPKHIHALGEPNLFAPAGYPAPIVDHSVAAAQAKMMFKVASSK